MFHFCHLRANTYTENKLRGQKSWNNITLRQIVLEEDDVSHVEAMKNMNKYKCDERDRNCDWNNGNYITLNCNREAKSKLERTKSTNRETGEELWQ